MTQINNNGMGNKVAAANNNINFTEIIVKVGSLSPDTLKYYLKHDGRMDLGDGMILTYVPTDDCVLRVNLPDGNFFTVVKNHSVGSRCNWKYIIEQVRRIVCRHYNVPIYPSRDFPTFNDWAIDLKENGFCNSDKRRAKFDACFNAIGA